MSVLDRVENIVGKGEIVCTSNFSFSHNVFKRLLSQTHQKVSLCGNVLMLFPTVFQLYRGGQCTYPCFPGVALTSTLHNFLSKPLAAFLHNHCRNSSERGMNPVAMTIINPQKDYRPSLGSNQPPTVLQSATLLTELGSSAEHSALQKK